MSIILIEGLKMNPALVGTLMGLPRLTDALTDPIMGYLSDRTRSGWGRRRPYIFFGALFSGILFALLWQLPEGQSENFYFWFFPDRVDSVLSGLHRFRNPLGGFGLRADTRLS